MHTIHSIGGMPRKRMRWMWMRIVASWSIPFIIVPRRRNLLRRHHLQRLRDQRWGMSYRHIHRRWGDIRLVLLQHLDLLLLLIEPRGWECITLRRERVHFFSLTVVSFSRFWLARIVVRLFRDWNISLVKEKQHTQISRQHAKRINLARCFWPAPIFHKCYWETLLCFEGRTLLDELEQKMISN